MQVNVLGHTATWALIEKNGNKGYYPISKLQIQLDEFASPQIKTVAATVIRSATICMGLSPYSLSFRTKIPMLPQKHPARIISSGPAFRFFVAIFIPPRRQDTRPAARVPCFRPFLRWIPRSLHIDFYFSAAFRKAVLITV